MATVVSAAMTVSTTIVTIPAMVLAAMVFGALVTPIVAIIVAMPVTTIISVSKRHYAWRIAIITRC